jgi:hypothetical protein
MTHSHHERLLAYTVQRAKARPEYMAWVLARYIEQEQISENELAQRIGIMARNLPHLALCLRPRADHFIEDVGQISAKFNINPTILATVVRLAESFDTLAASDVGQHATDAGLLMAARVCQHPPTPPDHECHKHDHPKP